MYAFLGHFNFICLLCVDDWRCDQWRWCQNGIKKLPKKNPLVVKTYFVTVTPSGNNSLFKRHAYNLIDSREPVMTLVHYIGDHTAALNFAHGNSKDSNRVHIRTCPSVLKAMATVDGVPSNIYKKEIGRNTCTPQHQPVLKPRNSKQISNVQAKERQTVRLTHDAIYNLHEISYDLNGFVSKLIYLIYT